MGECAFCTFYMDLSRKHFTEPNDDEKFRAHLKTSHGWKPELMALRN